MNVGILMITHGEIGQALLATANATLDNTLPLPTKAISVTKSCDPEQLQIMLEQEIQRLDQGDGVLILTDMYGATPGNIAKRLYRPDQTRVVAGLNLPMLLRIMNYPRLSLTQLAKKAISGGKSGIIGCDQDGVC